MNIKDQRALRSRMSSGYDHTRNHLHFERQTPLGRRDIPFGADDGPVWDIIATIALVALIALLATAAWWL